VIDDDPAVRDMMVRTLSQEGFRVETACSGAEGLALARQLKPAAITLDVLMPGQDGWAVLSALKADPLLSDIPVIMLTIVDDKNLGFSLGAAEYFTKPIDWARLTAVLRAHRKDSARPTVLVVDDEESAREMLRRTLQNEGWQVATVANGRQALETIRSGVPQLILLDLLMPEMDGFEFLQVLRERPEGKQVPVIIMTAKDLSETDHQRLNDEVTRIVQKSPTRQEQWLEEIRALLAPGRVESPSQQG
jgi:CheY-like chemotaxis protein